MVGDRNRIYKHKHVMRKLKEGHRKSVVKILLPASLCVFKKQTKTVSLFKLQLNYIYYSKTTGAWCII